MWSTAVWFSLVDPLDFLEEPKRLLGKLIIEPLDNTLNEPLLAIIGREIRSFGQYYGSNVDSK